MAPSTAAESRAPSPAQAPVPAGAPGRTHSDLWRWASPGGLAVVQSAATHCLPRPDQGLSPCWGIWALSAIGVQRQGLGEGGRPLVTTGGSAYRRGQRACHQPHPGQRHAHGKEPRLPGPQLPCWRQGRGAPCRVTWRVRLEVHCGLRAQCPGTSGAGASDAAEAPGRAAPSRKAGRHFGAWDEVDTQGRCVSPAAVPERGLGGEPRTVPEGAAERRQHLREPHEEQPRARPQHHQRLGGAVPLPVHQRHAPPAAGAAQPAGRAPAYVPAPPPRRTPGALPPPPGLWPRAVPPWGCSFSGRWGGCGLQVAL